MLALSITSPTVVGPDCVTVYTVTTPRMMKTAELRARLEQVERTFGPSYLPTDPIELVRSYHHKKDIEIAGVIAAGLAFGNAQAVRASVRAVLTSLGPRPTATLNRLRPLDLARRLAHTGHRWITSTQITELLLALSSAQRRHQSLEMLFLQGDDGHPHHLSAAMDTLVDRVPQLHPFFAAPRDRSACKRFCLFLRWMVRPSDGIDLGVWPRISPARLTIPLDVHLSRISRQLGLTTRKSDDWKTAQQITAALRHVCPEDPLRYDFALCRLGMVGVSGP